MSSKAMSLKSKIKNYARENNIAAQVVLQNYMFERFLERLSKSEYKQKFIIKGGILVAAIIGLDIRSTMDLDTTVRNISFSKENILESVKAICNINLNDETIFLVKSLSEIRKDDQNGGFCVKIDALYDTIVTPLSIDISIGDIITPSAIKYTINGIFDENLQIKLWGYNIETVMAEKIETILHRGVFNTRAKDFYDIYILGTSQSFDIETFEKALYATSQHRDNLDSIKNSNKIISQLLTNQDILELWKKYQTKFAYAREISFTHIINFLQKLLTQINETNR